MIRVAFVGCGEFASKYLSVYRDLPFVHVAACVGGRIESAQRATSVVGGVASTDFAAALSPEIDAVIINTPNSLHREQAIAAIRMGKHVLLQKPVAATIEDAEAIAAEAEKSSRTIGMYMSYFDQPLTYDLREMISSGFFGDIVHFYARLMHTGGIAWSQAALEGTPNWRSSLASSGGGCFLMLAVHFIHTFRWISGAKIVRVTGFTRNLHSRGIEAEDLACAVLELDSGALVTLDMAWCASGELASIHGTRGQIDYANNETVTLASGAGPFYGRVVKYSSSGKEERQEILAPDFGDASNPFNQHRVFLEAVRDGRRAQIPIREGIEDMRVVFALYESARTGHAVELS